MKKAVYLTSGFWGLLFASLLNYSLEIYVLGFCGVYLSDLCIYLLWHILVPDTKLQS